MRRSVVLSLVLAAVVTGPAAAQEADRTLGVQGVGEVELAPDVGSFSAFVRRTAPTSSAARTQANARLRRIVAGLTALGIPRSDISTTSVSLQRERYRPKGQSTVRVRWNAAGGFGVRVEGTDLVGRALEAAARAGATSIDGPDFSFTAARETLGRKQAEEASLADARGRADAAAASQGQRVVGVRSIELDPGTESRGESSSDAAAPAPARTTSGSAGSAPAPVLPGRETFTSTVRVVYLLQPA